jgi:hypothetical protein
MTTYQIVADTSRTYGLRNKDTGQIDQGGFVSIKMIREFWEMHFSWRPNCRIEWRS